jgi:hypothetical protein
MLTRLLLICGILSSILYVAMNIFIPLQFPGYSQMDYTISELTAIGAPTREIWVPFGILYVLLLAAFGWGILRSTDRNHRLRIVGILMIAYCAVNIYWPPMHSRGIETTLTDTLHIVWAFLSIGFMLTMMGYGAAAFGVRFRTYTVTTLVAYVIFGLLMSIEAPDIPKNLPTPYLGLWERIMIGLFLIWIAVLAVMLLNRQNNSVLVKETVNMKRTRDVLQKSY